MKRITIPASLALSLSCLGAATAQEVTFVGQSVAAAAEAEKQSTIIPAGAQLVVLERWINKGDTFSAKPLPLWPPAKYEGRLQGALGFISSTDFDGGILLHSCQTNDMRDKFTSRDANCEGHRHVGYAPIIGFIAGTQLPGTVPLYRCQRGGLSPGNWSDHFDSVDVNCEGVTNPANDGIIGYIWQ